MPTFAPELSHYWLPDPSSQRLAPSADRDAKEAADDERALQELAERVRAARTIL